MDTLIEATKWMTIAFLSLVYIAAATQIILIAYFDQKLKYHKRVLSQLEGINKWSTAEPGSR